MRTAHRHSSVDGRRKDEYPNSPWRAADRNTKLAPFSMGHPLCAVSFVAAFSKSITPTSTTESSPLSGMLFLFVGGVGQGSWVTFALIQAPLPLPRAHNLSVLDLLLKSISILHITLELARCSARCSSFRATTVKFGRLLLFLSLSLTCGRFRLPFTVPVFMVLAGKIVYLRSVEGPILAAALVTGLERESWCKNKGFRLAFSPWRSGFKDGHYYYTSRSVCCTTSRASYAPQDTTVLNRRSRKASQGEREARENPRIAQRAKSDRRKRSAAWNSRTRTRMITLVHSMYMCCVWNSRAETVYY